MDTEFVELHEFARELAYHLHRQRLEAVDPKGTILWEGYDEFLKDHKLLRAEETLRETYDQVEETAEIERYETASRPDRRVIWRFVDDDTDSYPTMFGHFYSVG